MDGMIEKGFTTYAIDLRGYGATTRDSSGWLTPNRAAKDVAAVLDWIRNRHGKKARLFGRSMGSTVSLLTAVEYPEKMKTLVVFCFWMDLDKEIPKMEFGDPELKRIRLKTQQVILLHRDPSAKRLSIAMCRWPFLLIRSVLIGITRLL